MSVLLIVSLIYLGVGGFSAFCFLYAMRSDPFVQANEPVRLFGNALFIYVGWLPILAWVTYTHFSVRYD